MRGIIAIACVFLVLGCAWVAASADDPPDGTFATGIAGWTPLGPNALVAFNSNDANGSAESGSLKVTNITAIDADNYTGADACYGTASGERRYPVFVKFRLPPQGIGGGVEFVVRFYSAEDCGGDLLNDPGNGQGETLGNEFFAGPKDAWSAQHGSAWAPAGTMSIGLRVLVTKRNAGSAQPSLPYFALVDDVAIGLEPASFATIPLVARD